jgi:hypothetical protein
MVFANVHSCSYDLKNECVISACIIGLYVGIGVYVGFPFFMLIFWLSVGLQVCDVFCSRSLLTTGCPGIKILLLYVVYWAGHGKKRTWKWHITSSQANT